MDTDYNKLDKEQRLKATIYYSVKQIAKEVEEEMDVTVSAQVLATLSECVNRQIEVYAGDLEKFAKHARRTNVNVDDVKLLVRRNNTVVDTEDIIVRAQMRWLRLLEARCSKLQHLNTFTSEKTALQANKKKPKTSSSKTGQPALENEDV